MLIVLGHGHLEGSRGWARWVPVAVHADANANANAYV